VNTVTTLSPATAATLDDLDTDPAVTMVGTVTHLSTFAPTLPTNVDAPATPTVTATAGDSQAVLSWAASSGATKYYIYEKSGATYPYLAETTSVSYTKTGLTNGTTYYYKVSAVNASDQESAASSEVSVTPAASSSGSGTVFIPPVSTPSQQPAAAEQSPAKTVTTTSGTTITLVRVAGDYKVYQIVDGVRIWIPTAEAFNALGFNWGDIKEVASDNNKGATLIRAEGDHKVYVLNGNVKKWVKTLEEFNAAGYKWSDVTVVKPGMLLGYTEEGGAATTNVTGQAAKKFVATLLPGTRGAIISQLQQRLKELGYLPQDHTVTQFFGPVTRAAVIKLQKEHSLSPQAGTVGPKTREVLNAE
jgi:fibronectin type 3 domain-containing protein